MRALFIINDAPYGSEKGYNALRLVMALQGGHPDMQVRVFLMADAVTAAIVGQETPKGYYNIERMLRSVLAKGAEVALCGSCCEARGISALPLIEGARLSSMAELARWTAESDKVLVF